MNTKTIDIKEMNLDEWRKSKISEIEEVYAILKPFNAIVKRGDIFDALHVDISSETFPYEKATKIRAQFEGTGYREQYDLTIYCWIGSLRACQQFRIKTDAENKKMISLLSAMSEDVQVRIASVLEHELNEYIRKEEEYASKSGGKEYGKEYAQYILQNPLTQHKIRRAKEAIKALSHK